MVKRTFVAFQALCWLPTTLMAQTNLRRRKLNPRCELCRDGSYPKDPTKGVVSLFFEGTRTCAQLYDMGQNREFTDQLCPALQAFMDQPCGCFFMTAPTPVAQPTSWTATSPNGSPWGFAPPSPGKAPAPVPVPVPVSVPVAAPSLAPVPAPVWPDWPGTIEEPTQPQPTAPAQVGWTQPSPTIPVIGWGSPDSAGEKTCAPSYRCTNSYSGEEGYFMRGESSLWGCYDACRPKRLGNHAFECGLCDDKS